MKKILVFIVLVVFAVYGCHTEDINVPDSLSDAKVFSATIEHNPSGNTKTSLDNSGNVLWKQGDQVSIFAGRTINEQYQVTDASNGKTEASLNRVTDPGAVQGVDIDHNVAFYPYTSSATVAKDGNSYIISDITLPATQNYTEASFGNGAFPMAAVTSSTTDLILRFKNILGGLKLQLKGTATIASISITGNNNEVLCGAAEVTVSNGSIPSISLSDASAKTVTLDCGSGVQLNTETATSFIIALPPMTMSGGFTVVVTDTEGKEMEISTTKSQTISRSNLLRMSLVTYEGVSNQGFNWTVVSHSVVEPLNYYSAYSWFVSDGVLYYDSGGKILTVDNESHTITATVNESDYYRGVSNRHTWTAPDGNIYTCFTTNTDSEYDDYYDVYRFENGRWEAVIRGIYFADFFPKGDQIWKTNNNLYTADGSTFYRSSNGYTFAPVSMSNAPAYFSNKKVWTSANGNVYYSSGTSHYRFNESSLSWTLLSTSGWPSITAEDVFIVGTITYWVSGGDCYMFNESSRTWTRMDNDFRAGLYGSCVWSYNGKYYYSDGTVNKELKLGGQTFTTVSKLSFPSGTWWGGSPNPPICNVNGYMIWGFYLKTPGTCIWNRLSTYSNPIVTLAISMSGQYYHMREEYDDEEYTSSYYLYPIDPTSGLHSSDYQYYGDGTTFYYAQSLWKDRNGVVHYSDDKRVFNDASGRCYYCCDSNGNTNDVRATHYRIYDETEGWGELIPLNPPTYMKPRQFWSDSEGNIYYTYGNTHYQLTPIN